MGRDCDRRKMNRIRCNRCLITDEIPSAAIVDGICAYCRMHDRLEKQFPISQSQLERIVKRIKKVGRKNQYDCLIGISGGCDSSYLLYLAVKILRLRPLVVHFDNRWNTEIAESNMERLISALNVDFVRHQLAKEMYDKVNEAFFEATVPDADIPNDMAMLALFKEVAMQNRIKYILNGHSFRTEGSSPLAWTYMDAKYIQSIYQSIWGKPLAGFPLLTVQKQIKAAIFGIREIRLLNYVDYRKDEAKKVLKRFFGWQDYGDHHSENKYSAFVTYHLLPKRFGIDKRIIEYSAFVRSGQLGRAKAQNRLKEKPCLSKEILEEVSQKYHAFDNVMRSAQVRSFKDFETYHAFFKRYRWLIWLATRFQLLPETFYIKYTRET